MARSKHILETTHDLWVFEPKDDRVEVTQTAFTGELGIQSSFSKEDARLLWVELRSDGALWEDKDLAES